MKRLFTLWLILVANSSFGQEADLGVELAVRPSTILATDQIGYLDILITNYGPNEKSGIFELNGAISFPSIIFGELVSGQCHGSSIFDPPPPGVPWFAPLITPVLSSGETEKCTISFQLDGSLPLTTVISMRVFPIQSGDPNQSNNVASITVTYMDARSVPLLGSIGILILCGLILLVSKIKSRNFLA